MNSDLKVKMSIKNRRGRSNICNSAGDWSRDQNFFFSFWSNFDERKKLKKVWPRPVLNDEGEIYQIEYIDGKVLSDEIHINIYRLRSDFGHSWRYRRATQNID